MLEQITPCGLLQRHTKDATHSCVLWRIHDPNLGHLEILIPTAAEISDCEWNCVLLSTKTFIFTTLWHKLIGDNLHVLLLMHSYLESLFSYFISNLYTIFCISLLGKILPDFSCTSDWCTLVVLQSKHQLLVCLTIEMICCQDNKSSKWDNQRICEMEVLFFCTSSVKFTLPLPYLRVPSHLNLPFFWSQEPCSSMGNDTEVTVPVLEGLVGLGT